jgi:hypothetical protein
VPLVPLKWPSGAGGVPRSEAPSRRLEISPELLVEGVNLPAQLEELVVEAPLDVARVVFAFRAGDGCAAVVAWHVRGLGEEHRVFCRECIGNQTRSFDTQKGEGPPEDGPSRKSTGPLRRWTSRE